jgi:Ca2+-binding RTX toxin-like protein
VANTPTQGDDILNGTIGNDAISGLGGNDTISGGGGNDFLHGNAGDDTLNGEADDDTLIGDEGDDTLNGGDGNDSLIEDRGNNVLNGGAGDDKAFITKYYFDPAVGFNDVDLGSGIDSLSVDFGIIQAAMTTVAGSATADGLSGGIDVGGVRAITFAGIESLFLTTGSGADIIHAFTHNDIINTGAGNDLIYSVGTAGADRIEGGLGVDGVVADWSDLGAGQAVFGSSGYFAVMGDPFGRYISSVEQLIDFKSGGGDDSIRLDPTGIFANKLSTNGGDDLVYVYAAATGAATAANIVSLGSGDDRLYVAYDILGSGDVTNIFTGTDADGTFGYFSIDGVVKITFSGAEFLTVATGGGNDVILGLGGNDDIVTGAGNDIVHAGAGDDTIDGGAGDDFLYGEGGSDEFAPESGADHIFGGDGDNDILNVDFSASSVGVTSFDAAGAAGGLSSDAGGGSAGSYSAEAGRSVTFAGIEQFDVLGSAFADDLRTGGGADTIDGGAGADTMAGGAGDDFYLVDNTGDVIIEFAGGGFDSVQSKVSYTLGAEVETLTLLGSAVSGTGNGSANIIIGNSGANIIDGGAGADRMAGEGGNDIYYVDNGGDSVFERADLRAIYPDGHVEIAESYGIDEIRTTLPSYFMASNVEYLTGLLDTGQELAGNSLANTIRTGAGNDVINGAGGRDTLIGGAGNDTYIINSTQAAGLDIIIELEGEGNDGVETSLSSFSLAGYANVENLLGTSIAGQTLTGNAAANAITGASGNDILDGGLGADTLTGGLGNDIYYVDTMGDVVVEGAGEGVDEVRTSLGNKNDPANMYVLAANVEKLTGTSSTGQGVFANALDNVIAMGAGNDLVVLYDGGADTVSGGAGNDFFYFGATFDGADKVAGGTGFDTVGLAGVYNLTLTADSLVGVEKLAVYTSGDAAAPNSYSITTLDVNVAAGATLQVFALTLGAGESFMFLGYGETDGAFDIRSGAGNDTLVGGLKNDMMSGGAGDDAIYALNGNDRLDGGLGRDTLYGGGGEDIIAGGAGGDILNGGFGNDRFVYGSAAESTGIDFDTIQVFDARVDKIDLPTSVSGWTGNVKAGQLSIAGFDADLATALDGALEGHSAVLFRPDAGDFAGRLFMVVDGDGDGSYQVGHDYVFELINPLVPVDTGTGFFV